MTRGRFLFSLTAGVTAVPSYAFGLEPRWLEETLHNVQLPGRGLAGGLKILHLSDFHASSVVPFSLIEKAVETGLAAKPDLICLTGDFVTRGSHFDEVRYTGILRRLSGAAPAFACLGNHDGGIWARQSGGFQDSKVVRKLLDDGHVTLLHNRSELVRIAGQPVRLAGVGDLWSDEVDPWGAFTGLAEGPGPPTILLAHNPDTKDLLADRPWDLMLSGHTHGGQVLIPFLGPCFAPVSDKRFVSGLKPWNGRQIYVTRGVGNVGGVRWNCRPEVSLLHVAG